MVNIEAQSIWTDEGFTYFVTQYPDPLHVLVNDVHPALYFLLMRGWVLLTGSSELALRYFSVLPGILSIALVYQIGCEILRQRQQLDNGFIPLTAALLMALADAEIFLAQEARSYTWVTCFSCLSLWAFLRWQRSTQHSALSTQHFVWLLSTIALIYTFYLAALVGVVQGIFALVFLRGKQRLIAIGTLLLAAITLLPWLMVSVGNQTERISYADWIRLSPFVITEFRTYFFGNQWALHGGLLLLALVIMGYAGEKIIWRWRPFAPIALIFLWLIVPIMIIFGVNEFVPLYTTRRIAFIAPAIAMLIAFGLGNFRPFARGFLLSVIVIYSLTSVDFYRPKQPWREMMAEVAPYIAPADLVLSELGAGDYEILYHFDRYLPPEQATYGLATWRLLEPATYEPRIGGLIDSHDTVWLFYWQSENSDRGALNWLNTLNFQRTAEFTFDFNPNIFFYRYDRLPEKPLVEYENGMVLHAADWQADSLRVDLVWSTPNVLPVDYTTSVFLLDSSGQTVAQMDSQPFLSQRPTTRWQPNEKIYDPKILQLLGADLLPGDYQIGVTVYHFTDMGLENVPTLNRDERRLIGTLEIRKP